MPHHRKPCMHGTNTPPCFIAAVSSHWCSHREICLDAFAGSDAENSRCQRAEYVVVGSSVFFVVFLSFSAVFISPSVVYRKPECDLFLLSGEKTPTKDDTRLPLTAKHLNPQLWTNHRCSLLAVPFVILLPRWEESTAGFTVCEHWGVPSVGELRLLYLCFQAQGDWDSAGRKCHKRVRCAVHCAEHQANWSDQ